MGGKRFSFSITEPEGWVIDFRSAAQIANFVMHPVETTWREASVVAFCRFIAKGPKETLEVFMEKDVREFQQRCPFYEIQDVDLEVQGARKFLTRELYCPSVRHEVVAVTEVPGFFVTFVLSSDRRDPLRNAFSPFQELLSSFLWVHQKTPAGPVDSK